MKAKILKITKTISQYGGHFYYIFFKGDDGKSYKTCVGSQFRNFKHWQPVIEQFKDQELWLDGLFLSPRDKRLIDADSVPVIISITGCIDGVGELYKTPTLAEANEIGRKHLAEIKAAEEKKLKEKVKEKCK